jgi:hypothetical protein
LDYVSIYNILLHNPKAEQFVTMLVVNRMALLIYPKVVF